MQNFYLYFTASIFTGYVLSYKIYMGKLCRKEELEDKKKKNKKTNIQSWNVEDVGFLYKEEKNLWVYENIMRNCCSFLQYFLSSSQINKNECC